MTLLALDGSEELALIPLCLEVREFYSQCWAESESVIENWLYSQCSSSLEGQTFNNLLIKEPLPLDSLDLSSDDVFLCQRTKM